jgi:DNA-binding NtrC family response regulator
MDTPRILIFGVKEPVARSLVAGWTHPAAEFSSLASPAEVLRASRLQPPALLILGCNSRNPEPRLKLINDLRQMDSRIPIILMTEVSSEDLAIKALKAGVDDYYKAPFSAEEVITRSKQLIEDPPGGTTANRYPPDPSGSNDRRFIGESPQMRDVRSYLAKVARSDSTVLITGETGTGKELAANLIHSGSTRCNQPLVCVNCAALPENLVESELFGYDRGAFTGAVSDKKGQFELARSGTILLDEIGDMNSHAQAKILRIIESKEFSHLGGRSRIPMKARVIAATNRDPEKMMMKGKFRKDLFYRLNVARVHLPSLRDRKDDIPGLVQFGIRKLNRRFRQNVEGLSESAMSCLYRYEWPGNVRELLNLLEAIYISLSDRTEPIIDLPKNIKTQLNTTEANTDEERRRILSVLFETNWNKSSAAQKLNWSRMTLYRKIAKYNIVEKRSPERQAAP